MRAYPGKGYGGESSVTPTSTADINLPLPKSRTNLSALSNKSHRMLLRSVKVTGVIANRNGPMSPAYPFSRIHFQALVMFFSMSPSISDYSPAGQG